MAIKKEYIYIYTYICILVCVCVCVYIYIYIYTHTHISFTKADLYTNIPNLRYYIIKYQKKVILSL